MKTKTVHDSMGSLEVPANALYAAQTQRAVNNFKISNLLLPKDFIKAIATIKYAAAKANEHLGLLNKEQATLICEASKEIIAGKHIEQFPIDVFQTGSGTSTNMNCNEVIASLAGNNIHPNDHVNKSQSSNDVIPTAIHISAVCNIINKLFPALDHLSKTLTNKAEQAKDIVKTGRTHLMDAMPITFQQEIMTWAKQISQAKVRLQEDLTELKKVALGGTAVGTGINAPASFKEKAIIEINNLTKLDFSSADNLFERIATQDTANRLSGSLRSLAASMHKIAEDLRWMNSGPLSALQEISLPALQPGSSIMPGKINPVISEAISMVYAQVCGNDTTINIAASSGNFQLNVMLPIIAYNLIQSIDILSNAAITLADKAIKNFTINEEYIKKNLNKNPILITALNSVIGYEKGAKIAKKAYEEKRSILELAIEMTDLSKEELQKILDPKTLTYGGTVKK